MTPLYRKGSGDEWDREIRPYLPLPLTTYQAGVDLCYLVRAGLLARPVGRGWRGYGGKELAERWGWTGDTGERRAHRLMAVPARWADEDLTRMDLYKRWVAQRESATNARKASLWEQSALAEQGR